MDSNNKLILFDICGTLYSVNTTVDFIDFVFRYDKKYARQKKILNNIFVRIANKIIYKIFHVDISRNMSIRNLKGFHKDNLVELAHTYYENRLNKLEIEEVHQLLSKVKQQLNNVILISATLDILAEEIGKQLDVGHKSSVLKFDDNQICEGKLMKDLLGVKENEIDTNRLQMVVTDNKSDYQLLSYSNLKYIVTNKKNINYWENKNLLNVKFIYVV